MDKAIEIGRCNAICALDNGDGLEDPFNSYLQNTLDTADEYDVSREAALGSFLDTWNEGQG